MIHFAISGDSNLWGDPWGLGRKEEVVLADVGRMRFAQCLNVEWFLLFPILPMFLSDQGAGLSQTLRR